jgi:hypothetical protein
MGERLVRVNQRFSIQPHAVLFQQASALAARFD